MGLMNSSFRQPSICSREPVVEPLEGRRMLHDGWELHVQFAPATVTPVEGYVLDSGLPLDERANGFTYGWSSKRSAKPISRSPKLASPDPRFSSFVQLKANATWQLELPNDTYEV